MDFPLLEWDEDTQRYHAMHHPFTSPKPGQLELLKTNPGDVKANAYDLVLNGNEIGGGSIRIHDKETQSLMFDYLGFHSRRSQSTIWVFNGCLSIWCTTTRWFSFWIG